jgi:glycosyltransferase involved in cell wall biosynthesis
MRLGRIFDGISYGLLRLCVVLRDFDLRHLRVIWHGLRNGAWTSIQAELFPSDTVLTSASGLHACAATPDRGRKQVLLIDRSLPRFDRDAGSRASWQYIQLLSDMGFSVTVWGHDYLRREPYASLLENQGVRVLSGWTIACGRWRAWVRRHAQELNFVVLQRPNVAMAYIDYFRRETEARILYFGVDLRWLRNQRRYEVDGQALFRAEAHYWQAIEADLIRKADFSYFYSNVEVAMATQQVAQARVRALPLFLYQDKEEQGLPHGERQGLMFIGGFAHQPNVDGILWFVNEVFPLIQASLGEVTLRIVGANPPTVLRGQPNLELLGAVSDAKLRTLYSEARIVVAPLRYGAGIKGKVVEALFHQVPLVTTSIGAEGLPSPASVMDVCDLPSEFSDKVCSLYVDDALWTARTSNIKTYLAAHFSQDSARQTLEEVMS